jgi:hypothetical protein
VLLAAISRNALVMSDTPSAVGDTIPPALRRRQAIWSLIDMTVSDHDIRFASNNVLNSDIA